MATQQTVEIEVEMIDGYNNGMAAVIKELQRAMTKYPTWPNDPLHALAVLGEEFGELTKAMLQLTYEPHKTSSELVREEAVQTAAMALRLVASLSAYQYIPSAQHKQVSAFVDGKEERIELLA